MAKKTDSIFYFKVEDALRDKKEQGHKVAWK